jgi:hypothetical protein
MTPKELIDAFEPTPVAVTNGGKIEGIGKDPRLLLGLEYGLSCRPCRTPREELRSSDDGGAALVATDFMRGVGRACHNGEIPS